MTDVIAFGSKQITYEIKYVDRKSLGITVTPEMQVIVKVPPETSLALIREKVHKRAPWIIKQLSYFLSFHPRRTERTYVSGETHLYMGRQYLLKVILSEGQQGVKYRGRYIEVHTKEKAKAKDLLLAWYRERAEHKFKEIAAPLIQRFKSFHEGPSAIQLREMPSRWGSCTPKGKIILNPELIMAPKRCIEYVIIHELCHLLHPHHNQAFFELQTLLLPDWEKWKQRLEQLLA